MGLYMLSRFQLKIANGATICYSMAEVLCFKFEKFRHQDTKAQNKKIEITICYN